jgi:hypothetical protein
MRISISFASSKSSNQMIKETTGTYAGIFSEPLLPFYMNFHSVNKTAKALSTIHSARHHLALQGPVSPRYAVRRRYCLLRNTAASLGS